MGFSRQEYWSGVPFPSLLLLLFESSLKAVAGHTVVGAQVGRLVWHHHCSWSVSWWCGQGVGFGVEWGSAPRGSTASPARVRGEPAACDLVQCSSSSLLNVLVLMSGNVQACPLKENQIFWEFWKILYKTAYGNPRRSSGYTSALTTEGASSVPGWVTKILEVIQHNQNKQKDQKKKKSRKPVLQLRLCRPLIKIGFQNHSHILGSKFWHCYRKYFLYVAKTTHPSALETVGWV